MKQSERTYPVDVEWSVYSSKRSESLTGGEIHSVHFASKRSQTRFVRALEKLCRESADGALMAEPKKRRK